MIFYVSSLGQSNDLHNKKCSIVPQYAYAHHITKEYATAVKNYLRVFDVLKGKSDIDKEFFVHDYCLSNFSYDHKFGIHSFSVLGPVLNKAAVCEGIAKFVKIAFDHIGVKSLVVSGIANNPAQGSAMEAHAWNIVKIGGKTYHLDVTFDMTLTNKVKRYDYFNLSDHDIKKDHVIINDVPSCTTMGHDFYSLNSLSVSSSAELNDYIGKALKQSKKNILVKIMNLQYSASATKKIMEIAQRQYGMIYKGDVMVEIGYNPSQMVFEINFK